MKAVFLSLSVSRQAGGLFDCMRRLGQELIRGEQVGVAVLGLQDADTVRDLGTWDPVSAQALHAWSVGGLRVAPAMHSRLHAAQPDVVHTHGLWSYGSVAAARWRASTRGPTIISPHGMLDPWALRQSHWKKHLVGLAFEHRHLRGATCLHALCAAEAKAIRAFGLRNPICTIPNGVDLPPAIAGHEPPPWAEAVSDERRVLLYLGRIHPKKGLANLLHAWTAVRAMAAEGAWTLVIAGWDQGGHAAELAALSTRLELKELVCFTGPLYGTQKAAAYRCANAFVLPSLSEGLPLVVLEAWSYARPVVLTSACNLPEGAEVGAALTCHPDVPGLTEALRALLDRSDGAREEMGLRGRALVAERFTWSGAARQMAQVYRWSRGLGGQPDCVSF